MSATVYLQTGSFLSYTTMVMSAFPDGSATPVCTGLSSVSDVSGLTSRKQFTSSSLTGVHFLQLFGNPSNRSGSGYTASSTTSLATAGSGSKAFTVSSGLSFTAGDRIRATSSATGEWMEGTVTAYSSTTLTVTMDLNCGTSTHADWSIGCVSSIPFATFWITLATSGTLWGADTREGAVAQNVSVTIPSAVAQASQVAGLITIVRGYTLRATLPAMGDISSRTKLTFTAKLDEVDADSASIIQVTEAGGLTVFNGSSTVTAGHASLTVSDASAGTVLLVVNATETAQLVIRDLIWDCQAILSTGVSSPVSGAVSVVADVTKATS